MTAQKINIAKKRGQSLLTVILHNAESEIGKVHALT